MEQEILDDVTERISTISEPWDMFETGIIETLEICARPDIQRIVFREAPSVIGLREWRDIEVKYAFGLMRMTVQQLVSEGLIKTSAPDMTSQILLGALIEAAHSVAEAENKHKALTDAKATMETLLGALKKRPQ